MKQKWANMIIVGVILAILPLFLYFNRSNSFVSYVVDPQKQEVKLFWKDDNKTIFANIGQLNKWLISKNKKLLFAMNAGMYTSNNAPKGLFIENFVIMHALDTSSGVGNFYLQPNGVFYTDAQNMGHIVATKYFKNQKVKYATQSGPLLVIDGKINSIFSSGSKNLNIRNGVGILPDNKIIFAMSKSEINFYNFANYFKQLGCKDALYLDGAISKTYLPAQNWTQTDGNLGVIIGVTN